MNGISTPNGGIHVDVIVKQFTSGIIDYIKKKHKKDILEICTKTILNYINYTEKNLSRYYSNRYYFGVPAPFITNDNINNFNVIIF